MYNRYIAGSGQREREHSDTSHARNGGAERLFGPGRKLFRQLGNSFNLFGAEAKNAGLAGILKGLGLEEADSGDILLLLILLLVFLEGDNTELVIALAFMLLFGGEDAQNE